MAPRVAGGSNTPGSIREAAQEGADLRSHRQHGTTDRMFAFPDKRLSHGTDVGDGAVQPDGGVDAVCQQIPGHARPCCLQI